MGQVEASEARGTLAPSLAYLPAPPRPGTDGLPGNQTWEYTSAPAPMGVADLGVGSAGTYAYGTAAAEGTAELTSLAAFSPGDGQGAEAPDWVALQLNSVLVNVSFGAFGVGTFWLQEVVRMNGTSFELVDNVWNFSSPFAGMYPGSVRAGNGTVTDGIYVDAGPVEPLAFPLNVTLTEQATAAGLTPEALFGYSIVDPLGRSNGTFDTVALAGSTEAGAPLELEVDGAGANPYGLRDDLEFVLTGDGGGSNALVDSVNGSLSLDRWNATGDTFDPVPSAYDYGTDAAETSEGVAGYYDGPLDHLSAGGSLLYGLWNTSSGATGISASSGWIDVNVTLPVADGFLFVTNGTASGFGSAGWVPTNGTGAARFRLPPALGGLPYQLGAWANGRASNLSISIDANVSGSLSVGMAGAAGATSTPIYIASTAQAAAAAAALPSAGYAAGPNVLWVNATALSIATPFRQLNDLSAPVFELFAIDDPSGMVVHAEGVSATNASYAYQSGSTTGVSLPGWSGGVYLDRVAAGSSVENETEFGSDLNNPWTVVRPRPSAVGVYDSRETRIANVTGSGYGSAVLLVNVSDSVVTGIRAFGNDTVDSAVLPISVGVQDSGSESTVVENLTAQDLGAIGVATSNSTDLRVANISVRGSSPDEIECPGGSPPYNSKVFAGGPGPSAIGVCAFQTSGTSADRGNASGTGAWGVVAAFSTGVNATGWAAYDSASLGGVWSSTDVALSSGTVVDAFDGGWNLTGDSGVTVRNWTAVGGNTSAEVATDIDWAFFDQDVTLVDLAAFDDAAAVQFLELSDDIAASDVRAVYGSLAFSAFLFDTNVSIADVFASSGSYGIAAAWTTNATISDVTAENDSLGYLLDGGSEVAVDGTVAEGASMGVDLNDFANATVDGANATNASVAVDCASATNVSISDVSAWNVSTAVDAIGLDYSAIANVNASSPGGATLYYVNPVLGLPFTVGAVQLSYNLNLTVANVTSREAGFAVWDLESENLTVDGVRSWDESAAVQANYTLYAVVANVFAYGDQVGVDLIQPYEVTLESSTIEDSVWWGVWVLGGLDTTAFGNNFVANDGAGVNGTYDPAAVQAVVAAGGTGNFSWHGIGNYWSDWASDQPYGVGTYVNDTHPVAAFITNWLRFDETGLTGGLVWGVQVAGHAYPSVQPLIDLPASVLGAGMLDYRALVPTGWGASPASGAVDFTGANTTVTFVYSEPYFGVRFVADGLPNGTAWSVALGAFDETNTTSDGTGAVRFTVANGSYHYAIAAVPGYLQTTVPYAGQVAVAGVPTTVTLAFERLVYGVTFAETGLPSGSAWTLTFAGASQVVTAPSTGYTVPNGSYAYRIAGPAGWVPTTGGYTGTAVVAGANVTVLTEWRPARYTVTFVETGLASGVAWQVEFNGSPESSTTSSISFSVGNGSFAYSISLGATLGFVASPSGGRVSVNGSSVTVTIAFSPSGGGGGASFPWVWVVVGVAVVALIGGLWAVRASRRRPPRPSEDAVPDSDGSTAEARG